MTLKQIHKSLKDGDWIDFHQIYFTFYGIYYPNSWVVQHHITISFDRNLNSMIKINLNSKNSTGFSFRLTKID